MNDEERLYFESLMELAESLGHSHQNPLSLSLLCLAHGVTFEEKGKIFISFNEILRRKNFEELTVELFKEAMINITSVAQGFSEIVIIGFIKAYAKTLIPELYPFAMTL